MTVESIKVVRHCRVKSCNVDIAARTPLTFDAHCCYMGTATRYPVPDRVKPSFVIFDIQIPDTLTLRAERQTAKMSKITNGVLTRYGTGWFIVVPIWQQWMSKD